MIKDLAGGVARFGGRHPLFGDRNVFFGKTMRHVPKMVTTAVADFNAAEPIQR